MDVDAIIAEATAPVAAQTQPEIKAGDAPAEAPEVTEPTPEATPEEKPEAKEDSFPKKAVNAISRRDKKIGKQAEQIRALNAELSKLRTQAPKEAPKEADFEGKPYGEYLKAEAKHAAAEEITERETKRIESDLEATKIAYKEERGQIIADNAVEARKSFSDFDAVLKASKPVLDSLPPEIQELFLDADNGAFALYAVAKEGALEDLADMSIGRAAMTIKSMEDKGLALKQPKKATNAPAPMSPAKGTGTGGKPLHEQSVDELMKWVKS